MQISRFSYRYFRFLTLRRIEQITNWLSDPSNNTPPQGRLSHAAEDVGSMKETLKSAQHKAKLAEEEVSTMRQALSEARDTISR